MLMQKMRLDSHYTLIIRHMIHVLLCFVVFCCGLVSINVTHIPKYILLAMI